MRPYDIITETELQQFKNGVIEWMEEYGPGYDKCDPVSIESILRPWNEAKNEYLFKLLGNELIISKPFIYKKAIEEIENDMKNLIWNEPLFLQEWREKVKTDPQFRSGKHPLSGYCIDWYLDYLLSYHTLTLNRYQDESFKVISPRTGKAFEVTKGCKVLKILGKFAQEFNLKGFEEFRIEHSRILNTKETHGYLNISIHPNDYATMSDNSYDWDSCMSWDGDGGYCQGTVEMMNSPMVVVAYVSGDKKFTFGKSEWSNKKWRELFIVHEDIITEIAPYPFPNKDITGKVLSWLKELAVNNLEWNQFATSKKTVWEDKTVVNPEDNQIINFEFFANAMYNDFRFEHDCYLSTEINSNEWYEINYSGLTECLWCGETSYNWEDFLGHEGMLCCIGCDNSTVCDCCGRRISHREESYWVDGDRICEECWNSETFECDYCEGIHLNSSKTKIYIGNTEQGWISQEFNLSICDDCLDEVANKYSTQDELKYLSSRWRGYYYIDIHDLTQEGSMALADVEDLKDWEEYIPNSRFRVDRYVRED